MIIHLIIQTILRDPSGAVWTAAGSNGSRSDPSAADQVDAESPHVDPFRVAKEPTMFRTALATLIDGVAAQFAQDLTPANRRPMAEMADPETDDGPKAGSEDKAKPRQKKPADEDLPDPDPI